MHGSTVATLPEFLMLNRKCYAFLFHAAREASNYQFSLFLLVKKGEGFLKAKKYKTIFLLADSDNHTLQYPCAAV